MFTTNKKYVLNINSDWKKILRKVLSQPSNQYKNSLHETLPQYLIIKVT